MSDQTTNDPQVKWLALPADMLPTEAEVELTEAVEAERIRRYETRLAEVMADNPGKDWAGEGYAIDGDGKPLLYQSMYPIRMSKHTEP